jgi:hypothetical protein
MSWLKRVIAQLLGLQTQSLDNPVQPTQTAGLAPQTPTQLRGNKRSVATTKSKSAPLKAKSPKKVAPKATQVKSSKQGQKAVRKTSGQKAQ